MGQFSALAARRWPPASDEVRWGVPAAVICLLGAQLFSVVWVSLAAGLVYGPDPLPPVSERPIGTLPLFNLGLWVAYLAGPIIVKRSAGASPLADVDLRATPVQAGVGTLSGVVAQLAILPALYWVILRFVSGDPGRSAQELADRVDGRGDAILFAVAVVIVAPVVEEWFYRGMLLPVLARRFGPVVAAVGSSAVFALVHQELIVLPGLFVFALILAWLTMTTGRIGPAILAHMAFNATTVLQLLAL